MSDLLILIISRIDKHDLITVYDIDNNDAMNKLTASYSETFLNPIIIMIIKKKTCRSNLCPKMSLVHRFIFYNYLGYISLKKPQGYYCMDFRLVKVRMILAHTFRKTQVKDFVDW